MKRDTEIPTYAPSKPKGFGLGLEGDLYIYVLGSLVLAVMVLVYGIVWLKTMELSILVAVIIPTTTYSFLKTFISGKPPHNLMDKFWWYCPMPRMYKDTIRFVKNDTFTISEHQPRHEQD